MVAGGRTPANRITLNGTVYPISDYRTTSIEPLLEEWKDGFIGGLGAHDVGRGGRDRYFSAYQMDTSSYPVARLRPTDSGAVHTIATLDMTYPLFALIATDASAGKYIVVLNGRYGYKFDSTGATLHTTKDFGASAICGRPAFFEGVWHIPLGASVTAVRWTTVGVGAGADTYTAIPNSTVALHFAGPVMKDGTAQLWRAHSTNVVDATVDSTAASGGFGDDFEIGDSGIGISDLLVADNQLYVVKPDNIYQFDINGQAFRVQTFISLPQLSAYGGSNSYSLGSYLFWPVGGRLWRIVSGNATPIDPSVESDFNSASIISGVEIISTNGNATYGAVTGWGDWIYWSTGISVLYGKVQDGNIAAWHGSLYYRPTNGTPLRVALVGQRSATTVPFLVIGDNAGAAATLRFLALSNDGSPRADLGTGKSRGIASDTYRLLLPRTDFGYPNRTKQLRSAWIFGLDLDDTGVSTQLAYYDEAGTGVTIGSAITADGYTSRALTAGTNDTAVHARLVATITTAAGYVTANSDPRIYSCGILAAPRTVYTATIIVATEALNATAQNQTTVLQALMNLTGQSITIVPPYSTEYGVDSYVGYVLGVRELALTPDDPFGPGYRYEVEIERFTYGS